MIKLIEQALKKPLTVVVAFLAIVFFAGLSIRSMKLDIFPKMGLPTIYVAQPYGGLSPEQMEGFITSYYEYHFLYVTGIKYVESKSIQGAAIIKIEFNEGTDMAQAMGEVVGYVNRSRAFMPPGTVPPFITRFDAGSVPVGQLVFTSSNRSLGEIQDLALFKVRPMFSTLPGVSAPPPFGGNQKTVIIKVDPEKIANYKLSPDEIVQALAKSNSITPAGNIRVGDQSIITSQNSIVDNIKELETVPLQSGQGPAIYIRDIATVEMGTDITTGYALINGKRSVYIPVTKRADAATWDVVSRVKNALPAMQAAVPEDIKVSYEFDQSGYVINALKNLLMEGILGALLTGLMVFLFLRDLRGSIIVVVTIPLSILTALICLKVAGQTLNIMTLGGLTLAIGILVDESTVTIENIYHHLELGKGKALAIWDATREIAPAKLLILLCVLAVFVPAFFMSGIPGAMFLPLSMSVGFAMITSFLLSQTFVPVLAHWLIKNQKADPHTRQPDAFSNFKTRYRNWLNQFQQKSGWLVPICFAITLAILAASYVFLGTEIFPRSDAKQTQVRLRLPTGTRIERTETAVQKLLDIADSITKNGVEISSAFVGVQPSSYPVNLIHLWTSGPHEAVVKIKLTADSDMSIHQFKEAMRENIQRTIPDTKLSFEPGEMVEQVMNMGSGNPIEINITGRNLSQSSSTANTLLASLNELPELRDVQIATPLQYPGLSIQIDRMKAGQLGLTMEQISKSAVTATSSSRFTQPNYWLDKSSGTAYQVQVEYPQYRMNSQDELGSVPLHGLHNEPIYLRDVASFQSTLSPGEYARINQQRFVTITANVNDRDIGQAINKVRQKIANLGALPAGMKINMRGQANLLDETISELRLGLLIAIVVIFLLLAINFQSFKLSLIILTVIPSVVAGSLVLLWITGQTLNIQSYMGAIMALGVAVSNAILLVNNGEQIRRNGNSTDYATMGAVNRLRPILMTTLAMIAGMIPMAIGLGEGGDQTAPLGIAVIGGLIFSTITTLIFLPAVYQRFIQNRPYRKISLHPDNIVHQ